MVESGARGDDGRDEGEVEMGGWADRCDGVVAWWLSDVALR